MVTLVPERREEITTEGGLDVATQTDSLRKLIRSLKDAGLMVSLFIDPSLDQVRASHKCDADRIELHTGRYCDARRGAPREQELTRIVDTAKTAAKLGIGVAAGHGLNYDNVEPIARISEIDELNIGHAIVARAVLVGFDRAVREMIAVMRRGS
jgi:pyridoxine 5-phosphate synthase